jgi:hypothetical protein
VKTLRADFLPKLASGTIKTLRIFFSNRSAGVIFSSALRKPGKMTWAKIFGQQKETTAGP